ncbi:MAG: hypothetical protein ACI9VT_002869 [Psychroserpens sp.]|jgi:hypothetical protein
MPNTCLTVEFYFVCDPRVIHAQVSHLSHKMLVNATEQIKPLAIAGFYLLVYAYSLLTKINFNS